MTRALPFTEAKVRRALVGAQRAGLAVKAMQIGPDGTITLDHGVPPLDLVASAAHCRCSADSFVAMAKDGLFPLTRYGRWVASDLDAALRRIDLRPGAGEAHIGEVYFIRCERFVKIGFSGSARTRMRGLCTGNPFDLELLATISAGRDTEEQAHALFKHLHHRGEWFKKSPGLLAYVGWLKARPK